MKGIILGILSGLLAGGFMILSIKTNWFNFSLTTFLIGYFIGLFMGFIQSIE